MTGTGSVSQQPIADFKWKIRTFGRKRVTFGKQDNQLQLLLDRIQTPGCLLLRVVQAHHAACSCTSAIACGSMTSRRVTIDAGGVPEFLAQNPWPLTNQFHGLHSVPRTPWRSRRDCWRRKASIASGWILESTTTQVRDVSGSMTSNSRPPCSRSAAIKS